MRLVRGGIFGIASVHTPALYAESPFGVIAVLGPDGYPASTGAADRCNTPMMHNPAEGQCD